MRNGVEVEQWILFLVRDFSWSWRIKSFLELELLTRTLNIPLFDYNYKNFTNKGR